MNHITPWNLTLRQRLSSLRPGTHRVAYFAPHADSGSFRYRCYNTTQAINTEGADVSASYFFRSDLDHLDNLANYADSLVVFRTPYDTDVERLIFKFRRDGKRVFFDIDDLIFDTRFTPLVTSSLNYQLSGKSIEAWFSLMANIGTCMKLCDEAITTNPYLAARISDFAQCPVTVIPNFLNQEQIAVSSNLYFQRVQNSAGGGLRLGYFSGSHSHAKDFEVAKEGILAFLKSSPRSTLTILGHLDSSPELEALGPRLIEKPFVDFVSLQDEISRVDVNLVPLQSTPFSFSKSELKFFEAALVGTITLATPTPVFQNSIEEGVNGFLCSAERWERSLLEIEQLTSGQRTKITQAAWETAMNRFSPQAVAPQLKSLFVDVH